MLSRKRRLCVGAILKNEGPYLLEWIAYHRIVGVEHFYLYDNVSEDGCSEQLMRLDHLGIITRIHWPRLDDEPPQRPAYRDLFARFGHSTQYMLVIDGDEFLVPMQHDSVLDVLPRFDDPAIGAVAVQWRQFGANGHERREPGLVIERFTACDPEPSAQVKTISKPSCMALYMTHVCRLHRGVYVRENGEPVRWSTDIPTRDPISTRDPVAKLLQVNHYFTKSRQEWQERRKLGKPDREAGTRRRDREFEPFFKQRGACSRALELLPRVKDELADLERQLAALDRRIDGCVRYIQPTRVGGFVEVSPPLSPTEALPIRLLVNEVHEHIVVADRLVDSNSARSRVLFEIPVTRRLRLGDALVVSALGHRGAFAGVPARCQRFDRDEARNRTLVEAAPENGDYLLQFAGDLSRGGQLDAALELIERVPAQASTPRALDFIKAELLLQAGHQDEAREALTAVVARNPSHAKALFELGKIAKARRNLPEAERLFARGWESQRDLLPCLYNLGVVRYEQGKFAEAEATFASLLKSRPRHEEARAYQLRSAARLDPLASRMSTTAMVICAELARRRGDHEEAAAHLREALRWDPWQRELHADLAVVLLEGSRIDEAERHLAKLRDRDSSETLAFRRSMNLLASGRRRQAGNTLRVILERSPEHVKALFELGKLAHADGDHAAAERLFARACAADQGFAKGLYLLGIARYEQRNYRGADEAFAALLRIDPEHERARAYSMRCVAELDEDASREHIASLLQRAAAASRSGDHARAEVHLREVVAFDPWQVEHNAELGKLLFEQGRLVDAEVCLAKVLAKRSSHNGSLWLLGLIRQAQGRDDDARVYLKKARDGAWVWSPYRRVLSHYFHGYQASARGILGWLVSASPSLSRALSLVDAARRSP